MTVKLKPSNISLHLMEDKCLPPKSIHEWKGEEKEGKEGSPKLKYELLHERKWHHLYVKELVKKY